MTFVFYYKFCDLRKMEELYCIETKNDEFQLNKMTTDTSNIFNGKIDSE